MSVSTVLLDLDGTLNDPYEGITRSIRHALTKMWGSAPESDDLRWCIVPPFAVDPSAVVAVTASGPAAADGLRGRCMPCAAAPPRTSWRTFLLLRAGVGSASAVLRRALLSVLNALPV